MLLLCLFCGSSPVPWLSCHVTVTLTAFAGRPVRQDGGSLSPQADMIRCDTDGAKEKSCSRYGMCDLKQETGPGRGIRAPPHRDVDRLLRPIGWAHRLAQQPRRPCWPQMARALEHRKARALLGQSTSTSARDPPPFREGGSSRATCPAALPPARPGSQVLRYSEHPWPPHLAPVNCPPPPSPPQTAVPCTMQQWAGDRRLP